LRGVAVTPLEHGAIAIDIMREARALGLVATMIPPALKTRNLDHADLDSVLRRRGRARHAARRARRARHPPAEDRRRPLHQLHPGALHQLPLRPDDGDDGAGLGRRLRPPPEARVAFLEAGVGWVPFFIDRLHEHYEKRGDWIPNGWRRDPQEY
jgi:hypothetical protein